MIDKSKAKRSITQKEVRAKIAGFDLDTQRKMVCAMLGHSRIQSVFFGYYSCGRCDTQLGDALGSVYFGAETAVIIGHNCDKCRENAKMLTWRDRLLTPDPFAEPVAMEAMS